jgi:hypothetical protein
MSFDATPQPALGLATLDMRFDHSMAPVYWQKAIEFEERQAQPRVVASE